jgi:ATP-dependent RNA helicase DHX36
VCYRVYTRQQHAAMVDHATPELLRTPLEELCLTIKSLGLGSAAAFISRALQPPEERSVNNALELLTTIGALDRHEELTPLGRHLAALPVDPRVGKMLITAAALGCLSPALTIAAGMAYKDPFVLPIDKKAAADQVRRQLAGGTCSDHVALVRAYEGWERARREGGYGRAKEYCWSHFLAPNTLELMAEMRNQFGNLLEGIGFIPSGVRSLDSASAPHNKHSGDVGLLRAVICSGMYPKLVAVQRRGKRSDFKTHEDGKVDIHPSSVNSQFGTQFPFPWMVYCEKVKTTGVYIRDSTCVPAYAVLLLGGELEEQSGGGNEIKILGGNYTFNAPPHILVGLCKLLNPV